MLLGSLLKHSKTRCYFLHCYQELKGLRVQDPSEVRPAIERALATDGPVLVDVLTNPSKLSMPPKTTFQQAQGYSLYLLKEILGGGAGGVVEDISSNLR